MAVVAAPIVTIGMQLISHMILRRIKSVILFKKAITGEFDTKSLRFYLIPLIATDSIITLWKQKNNTIVGNIAITDAAIISA